MNESSICSLSQTPITSYDMTFFPHHISLSLSLCRPQCSIKNIDLCDDEKKALIKKYQGMSVEELSTEVAKEEKKSKDAEDKFEEEVGKLQAKYEELSKEKDDAIAEIKAAGLGLLKTVLKSKEVPEKKDEL